MGEGSKVRPFLILQPGWRSFGRATAEFSIKTLIVSTQLVSNQYDARVKRSLAAGFEVSIVSFPSSASRLPSLLVNFSDR